MTMSVEPMWSWRKILLSAVIPIVVTVIGQIVVSKILSHEPKLIYSASQSLPFVGEGKNIGIYQVEIGNEGDKQADGLATAIRIPEASIDNNHVNGPGALAIETKVEGDTIRLSVPSLNPTETIHISILASSTTSLPDKAEVSVRANGVIGTERMLGAPRPARMSFASTAIVASAAVVLLLLVQLFLPKWRLISESGANGQDHWNNIGDVFWLGHDLMWTFRQVEGGSPRERILHGLKQSRHHAGRIGLSSTSPYRDLDSMYSGVGSISDANLTQQWRAEASKRVGDLISNFGDLAKAQQPDFQPSPQ